MKRTFAGAALSLDLLAGTQDMMYGVDLSSPVSAEMTRANRGPIGDRQCFGTARPVGEGPGGHGANETPSVHP